MTYNSAFKNVSKRVIQVTLTLMLVFFAWISYHQFMSSMSMDSMADHQASPINCLTLCFIATKIDVNQLTQSIYFTFTDSTSAFLNLLVISALSYLAVYYLRYNTTAISPPLLRSRLYYYLQRWKFKIL